MTQEREKIVERAVLTFVGLLALAAILVFLPDANAQTVSQAAAVQEQPVSLQA